MSKRRKITNEEKRLIYRLYSEGVKIPAISKRLGRDPTTISEILREFGVEFKRQTVTPAEVRRWLLMHLETGDLEMVVKVAGRSRLTVYTALLREYRRIIKNALKDVSAGPDEG